jgi:hypothetical protein
MGRSVFGSDFPYCANLSHLLIASRTPNLLHYSGNLYFISPINGHEVHWLKLLAVFNDEVEIIRMKTLDGSLS